MNLNCDKICNQTSHNNYSSIRSLCYNIIQYLITENEELWKLLKYNSQDALSKPNLTLKEKSDLIYNGIDQADNYRVFRSAYIDDSFDETVSQLRIYITTLQPDNIIVGTADIGFEVITHNKLINLDNYENRIEVMLQQLLQTLNGKNIGGVGVLYFDRKSMYNLARLNMYNNRNYYGYTLIMSTKVVNTCG